MYIELKRDDELLASLCATMGYVGRTLQVKPMPEGSFEMGDTSWSGGSRKSYAILEIATMKAANLPNFHRGFDGDVVPNRLFTQPGYIIIEHNMFCGNDMGLVFWVHADDFKTFALPPHVELTQAEEVVLSCTKSYISSYRRQKAAEYRVTLAIWDKAKATLIAKGLLNSQGALTINGKNLAAAIKLPNEFHLPEDWKPE